MKVCAQPPLWRADVISRSREVSRDNGLLLRKGVNGVGQLNLAVQPVRRLLQALEDLRAKDIAPHNGEV